jgi:hypothetical protein
MYEWLLSSKAIGIQKKTQTQIESITHPVVSSISFANLFSRIEKFFIKILFNFFFNFKAQMCKELVIWSWNILMRRD